MRIKSVVIAIAIILLIAEWCEAAEFSADEITSTQSLDIKTKKLMDYEAAFRGKVFVRGQMIRREYYQGIRYTKDDKTGKFVESKSEAVNKPKAIIIENPEKGFWYKIRPNQSNYMEFRYPPKKNYNPLRGFKYIGNETINGYECKKYIFTMNAGSQKFVTLVWWSTKLNYEIKTKTTNPDGSGAIREFKNISLKHIPDSLFQPPKGYKKVPFKRDK